MCLDNGTDLGFAQVDIDRGVHVCQIYTSKEERNNSLLKFILKGIEQKEASACFSDREFSDFFNSYVKEQKVPVNEGAEIENFVFHNAEDVYFEGNVFNPDHILNSLNDFYEKSVSGRFEGTRVIGEMLPEIQSIEGGKRLLEYESRVNLFLEDHPVTTVCQYAEHSFDGAMIMDVLKVHPMLVVHGAVVRNPFYMKPEEVLDN